MARNTITFATIAALAFLLAPAANTSAQAQAPSVQTVPQQAVAAPANTPERATRTRRARNSDQPAAERPRRQRSEAQLRNDQIMRDCGTEWRAIRDASQTQGKTWRTFLPECRARRRV